MQQETAGFSVHRDQLRCQLCAETLRTLCQWHCKPSSAIETAASHATLYYIPHVAGTSGAGAIHGIRATLHITFLSWPTDLFEGITGLKVTAIVNNRSGTPCVVSLIRCFQYMPGVWAFEPSPLFEKKMNKTQARHTVWCDVPT